MTSFSQPNGIFRDNVFFRPSDGSQLNYPILVVGGSTAAYSAVLGALQADPQLLVCLAMPKQVLGGQFTAQALPASDDGDELKSPSGELYAISKSQRNFRRRQRELQKVNGQIVSNPGGGWVSSLCVTPVTAARALNEALEPFLTLGRLALIPFADPIGVFVDSSRQRRRVTGVSFRDTQTGAKFIISAKVIIEATDLGDLLELGKIESRVGQEARSETGEQRLPEQALPKCQQTITFGIVMERTYPETSHRFNPPTGYDLHPWLHSKDFTSTFWVQKRYGQGNEFEPRYFFDSGSIFDYRRLLRTGASGVGDVAVINWSTSPRDRYNTPPQCCGNDYRTGVIVGVSREERQLHIQRAHDRAHAYAYYLHKQVGGLKPRGDLTWTSDGVALDPYIREARRGIAMTTIKHEDVSEAFFPPKTARARGFEDSIGIGQYHYLDIHGNDEPGQVSLPGREVYALPFTIPLGSLVPINTDGLILSSKSIGTTHITNSAYRMHPVEWAIGEAGGHLAVLAVRDGAEVRDYVLNERLKRKLQGQLARYGVPLFWFNDIVQDDPDFEAIQVMAAAGIVRSADNTNLNFRPQDNVNRAVVSTALVNLLGLKLVKPQTPTFTDVPASHWAYAAIETLYANKLIAGVGDRLFAPSQAITHLQLSFLVKKIDQLMFPGAYDRAFGRTQIRNQPLYRRELSRALYAVLQVKLASAGVARANATTPVEPESTATTPVAPESTEPIVPSIE
jgi:hypothetical protein